MCLSEMLQDHRRKYRGRAGLRFADALYMRFAWDEGLEFLCVSGFCHFLSRKHTFVAKMVVMPMRSIIFLGDVMFLFAAEASEWRVVGCD